jgi:hypothetical protein
MQTAQVEPVVVAETVNVFRHELLPLGVCSGSPSSPLRDPLPFHPTKFLAVARVKRRRDLTGNAQVIGFDLFDFDRHDKLAYASFLCHR